MLQLPSKIFIDGGIPEQTYKLNKIFQNFFGYPLDGQTTNPTLIAKNLQSRIKNSEFRIKEHDAVEEYKKIVQEISEILPHGSVSIQVFAHKDTLAEDMIRQAKDRITWIKNASIKLPCTPEGIKAAHTLCTQMPLNITLVFSQSQAAAVYEATKGASFPVFLSPFVGRLDDKGEYGMDLIKNIIQMYRSGDGHVQTLTASVRSIEHIHSALFLRSPIITIPAKTFSAWADAEFSLPSDGYIFPTSTLQHIPYDSSLSLGHAWNEYDLHHELTDKGVTTFWSDWTEIFS